jgi:zinc D-Ala-D-Ala carboxypeptidase
MKISKHLTLAELITSQTATRKRIDNTPSPQVIANLKLIAEKVFEPLREGLGKPIRISSGYRSPALNKAVGSRNKNSQHITGEALDLQGLGGLKNSEIFNYIKDNLDYSQLIWEYGTDKEPAWVHVSYKKSGNQKQILYIK